MVLVNQNKNQIDALCKLHEVEKLYLFGSATNSTFSETSDIDFLVKFKPFDLNKYFINYLDLKEKLYLLLN